MKSTGMVRDIDKVGRVVIPKEIRKVLNLEDNSPIEIFIDGESIILRKYEPSCIFCKTAKDLVTFFDKKICRECLESIKDI